MANEEFGKLFICGGCNAKIGPGNLSGLLGKLPKNEDPRLLVGFDSTDDAGVIKISDEMALIQTLDFFPTMVSDPYLFGKIAATNALSDVYAMGGDVLSAMNIVCFPEELDIEILGEILRGGSEKVAEAGAILVGGHSIHDSTPKYGLSVTGTVHPDKILKNNESQVGDVLVLTKPLGVGIITTAFSVAETTESAFQEAVESMTTLNKKAAELIRQREVHGCTDVTGFGLLGHLVEMMNEACSAVIEVSQLPYIEEAYRCAKEFLITAGGQRNRNYLSDQLEFQCDDFALEEILFDPQTSGGLLVSLPADEAAQLVAEMAQNGLKGAIIGKVIERQAKTIYIK
ncbi:selenide, water dikinase SelD [Vagococcus sp. BWB3-3]|uniref:Selenide, water dikinase n=1 Tax=Vagococcus allomyrinae TaxID=2794353 RepID=A0A940P3T7_9ENTE|nr:selenide, water dikinase SelD [Vagococcus allomyrinae]MBP1040505.1 selenide, water dikinase SelD [Vagococcus allomyrinae]